MTFPFCFNISTNLLSSFLKKAELFWDQWMKSSLRNFIHFYSIKIKLNMKCHKFDTIWSQFRKQHFQNKFIIRVDSRGLFPLFTLLYHQIQICLSGKDIVNGDFYEYFKYKMFLCYLITLFIVHIIGTPWSNSVK